MPSQGKSKKTKRPRKRKALPSVTARNRARRIARDKARKADMDRKQEIVVKAGIPKESIVHQWLFGATTNKLARSVRRMVARTRHADC